MFQRDPAGSRATATTRVDSSNTASAVGSGGVDVLSTPSLVCLMEQAARDAVQGLLLPGMVTVGTRVDIRHVSATPVGEDVSATAELLEVDGRRLLFSVRAEDRLGTVGEGLHERLVVRLDSFVKRTGERFGKTGSDVEEGLRNG